MLVLKVRHSSNITRKKPLIADSGVAGAVVSSVHRLRADAGVVAAASKVLKALWAAADDAALAALD